MRLAHRQLLNRVNLVEVRDMSSIDIQNIYIYVNDTKLHSYTCNEDHWDRMTTLAMLMFSLRSRAGTLVQSLISASFVLCKVRKFHIRNVGKIRKYIYTEATKLYVHVLVTTCLDFSNALLYDLPKSSLSRLQKVQNTAARFVSRTPKFSTIIRVFCDVHWLPAAHRITFKIRALLTFKALTVSLLPISVN